ncbi:MAG: radical SAM protein [Chloroflexi bacterium]|nr:MAG: radical SAM protein [Chloroflexota bacterium]
MAVIEIQAKTMLATIAHPDGIFGLKYNMNLYRGCQHQCIYCDSRSACYEIENFNQDVLVKINALELLEKELARKRVKGVVGTGSMNDPYMPVEKRYNLTRQSLELIARYGFGVHINTKSDLVVRDIELLHRIGRVHATVAFSISTTGDDLSRKIEPGAPPSSARFEAMRTLSANGVTVGTCMMPILPFLEDNPENITAIVEQTVAHGGSFIMPWFGMSMRDRQREYYYQQLDRLFPGLRPKYEHAFGERYECPARNAKTLSELFYNLCERYGLETSVPQKMRKEAAQQLTLF